MIRILGYILGLALMPQVLFAEVITVRSGEHAGFSRLVMQFSAKTDWAFGRSEQGYEFHVPDEDIYFDTSAVFQRIPRQRIANVKGGNAYLQVVIPENVHADVFELREGRVVIDIKDGAPDASSEFEQPLIDHVNGDETVLSPLEGGEGKDAVSVPVAPDIIISGEGDDGFVSAADEWVSDEELIGEADRNFPLDGGRFQKNKASNALLDAEDAFSENLDDVSDLERRLLEQIGRAVSQGLLEPEVSQADRAENGTIEPQEEAVSADSGNRETIISEEDTVELSHIHIQSSMDRERGGASELKIIEGSRSICLDDRQVQISQWGRAVEDGQSLSHLRAKILGEFDRPDPKGIRDLARYYLYLTFGAEAKSVLRDFGVKVEGHDILWAMADIMDQSFTEVSSPLSHQFQCDTSVALWSVLSKKALDPDEDYNMNSILSTFSALPFHLRRHLGPILSDRFLAIGDTESVQYIQNAMLRGIERQSDASVLLNAKLALAEGDLKSGEDKLKYIIAENGAYAPEALVKLIQLKAKDGEEIDESIAETVEAFAVEFRGDPFEGKLQEAAILAQIYSGKPDVAVEKVFALKQEEGSDNLDLTNLTSRALETLAQAPDDTLFLKTIWQHKDGISQADFSNSARLAVSRRLLDLGFFQQSLEFMPEADGLMSDDAKILLAEAFYGIGDMQNALKYALDVDHEESREIAAKAYFYLNDIEKAAELLKSNPIDAERETFALLAEDWESLVEANSPSMSNFANVMKDGGFALNEEKSGKKPSLASAEAIVASSQRAREMFEDVTCPPSAPRS
ncbi:hypothetical protein [Celeribacter halophilus]|uniref:Uncharacterized protein n=1 Tax=Celeribacter halophilus TaxID=576117 RepID=A0A1I3UTI1_9RHOB|nr:hypothetical protein [Celeribacter halophilus]PZX09982.1 hypothetical protein LX82_02543 [Celeribacter halophilus]SFJ86528.1 hypothetical protein SAMN04488138_112109 [Celeribacter halophilus]